MKKVMLWVALISFMMMTSGCTKTIEGIKEDTSNAWHGTKNLIHDATEE